MNKPFHAMLILLALSALTWAQGPLLESPLPVAPFGAKEVVVVSVTNGLTDSNATEALEILRELDPSRTEAVIVQIHCLMDTNWDEINLIMGGLGNLTLPTFAFVDSMAVDAGALLAFSTDKIYMAPASIIGGSPILGTGNMKAKLQSFNLATARSVAISKGRDPAIVEAIWNEELEIRLGDNIISKKGSTLMVEAQDAVQEHEGKPFLAEALVNDVYGIKEHAGLKGDLRFTNAVDPRLVNDESPLDSVKMRERSFAGNIVVIEVGKRDLVNSARFDYMGRILARAQNEKASAVILDLNTPGGLAWQTGELMMRSLAKMSVPTYAYVNPSAVSAGALIALAADKIYMSPVSAIGAAAVVTPFGDLEEDAEKKITSVLVPLCRSVARSNGHDPEYATKFMIPEKTGADADAKEDSGLEVEENADGTFKLKVKEKTDVGTLLSLAGQEALKPWNGAEPLAQGMAVSLEDLVRQEALQGEIIVAEPLGFEIFALWVTRFSAILLLGAFLTAQIELRMPGFGVFGFLSLALFGVFFFGHYAAGKLAGFEMVALFLLGVVLIVAELAFFPGTMVAGLTGFVCILVSLVYTMADQQVLPSGELSTWKLDLSSLGDSLWNLTLALGGAMALGLVMARFLPQSRLFDGLILKTAAAPSGTGLDHMPQTSSDPALTTAHSLVGEQGQTLTPLRPAGSAMIANEARDVVTDGEFVDSGKLVEVSLVEGSRIVVRPTEEAQLVDLSGR